MKIGKEFGQTVSVIETIKKLIKDYHKGVGIFKEYIQNADDAGANKIVFLIDEMTFQHGKMPTQMQWLHNVPSLLIYNDKPFKETDLEGIQNLHVGSKSDSASSVGRYGVGFNISYNITDVPYFFTNKIFYLFDPNCKTLPDVDKTKPGKEISLAEADSIGYPLLNPFEFFNELDPDQLGTIFRLPFRTQNFSPESLITNEQFTLNDASEGLKFLSEYGTSILLFLKHITQIKAYYRDSHGRVEEILSVEAENKDEIVTSRKVINEYLHSNSQEELFEKLKTTGSIITSSLQKFNFSYKDEHLTEMWAVVNGLFTDENNLFCDIGSRLIYNGDKAIPIAGVAYRLDLRNQTTNYYCSLPLPIESELPVNVNGFFDLDSSRHSIFLDSQSFGNSRVRYEWNKHLLESIIPEAYAQLIAFLRKEIGSSNPELFYNAFPTNKTNESDTKILEGTYNKIRDHKIIRTCMEEVWMKPIDIRTLPESLSSLYEDFLNDKIIPLSDPKLKPIIVYNFGKHTIKELKKDELSHKIKIDHDINIPLSKSPYQILNSQEKVNRIFRFCAAYTDFGSELKDLPIVVDTRGYLRTLGRAELMLLNKIHNKTDRIIFINYDDVLISELSGILLNEYSLKSSIPKITILDENNLIRELEHYLYLRCSELSKSYRETGVYSKDWILNLYDRLISAKNLQDVPFLSKNIAILPTTDGKITTFSDNNTVIPYSSTSAQLLGILDHFGANYSKTSDAEIAKKINELANKLKIGNRISASFIVDLISANIEKIGTLNQNFSISLILEYLSTHNELIAFEKDDNLKNKLKSLPIFPTTDGKLVTIDKVNLYVTKDDRIPEVPLESPIVLANDSFIKLLELFGINKCTIVNLIKHELLPHYGNYNKSDQIIVLEYIRMNFSLIREIDNELKTEISETEIIVSSRGKLVRPLDIYLTHTDLTEQLFGNDIEVPDYDDVYSEKKELWSDFFKELGAKKNPLLSQIVDFLESLVNKTRNYRIENNITEIVKYIDQMYLVNKYRDDDEEVESNLTRLKNLAWVPVLKYTDKLICFTDDETDYLCPSDVYFFDFRQLIGRQSHVTILNRDLLSSEAREFFGFNEKPELDSVLLHFDEVINWINERAVNKEDKRIKKQFDKFYEYFGSLSEEELEDNERNLVAKRYLDTPCIWHEDSKQLVKPTYSFRSKVSHLAPYAFKITSKDTIIDEGLKRLGRESEPNLSTIIEVLFKYTSDVPTPSKENIEILVKIYNHLVQKINDDDKNELELSNVPILIQEGIFRPCKEVLVNDAPLYSEYSNDWNLPFLHKDLAKIENLKRRLRLRSLADEVNEVLDSAESNIVTESLVEKQTVIQSVEFRHGLNRLANHLEIDLEESKLLLLSKLKVLKAKTIPVKFYLDTLFLSKGSTNKYFDVDNAILYVKSHENNDVMLSYIAKSLSTFLEPRLSELQSQIEKMIKSRPGSIDDLLDSLEIKTHKFDPEMIVSYDDEDDTVEYGEDFDQRIEVSNILNSSDEHDSNSLTNITPGLVSNIKQTEKTKLNQNKDEVILPNELESEDVLDTTPSNGNQFPSTLPSVTLDAKFETDKQPNSPDINKIVSDSEDIFSDTRKLTKKVEPEVDLKPKDNRFSTTSTIGVSKFDDEAEAHRSDDYQKALLGSSDSRLRKQSEMEQKTTRSGDKYIKRNKNRSNEQRKQLTSYVLPPNSKSKYETTKSEDSNEVNMRISRAAVKFVLEYERSEGRKAQEMTHSNKGYDVLSEYNGVTRYIEIKGTDGPWDKMGVKLSPSQFKFSIENPTVDYWLYVVENPTTPNAVLYTIQKPYEQVTGFMFDHGWKEAVIATIKPSDLTKITNSSGSTLPKSDIVTNVSKLIPQENDKVYLNRTYIGRIVKISSSKYQTLVHIEHENGIRVKKFLKDIEIKRDNNG